MDIVVLLVWASKMNNVRQHNILRAWVAVSLGQN